MAINLSGQAIQDVRVAGVQAQRVMLGTGTTAVEVWSARYTGVHTGPQVQVGTSLTLALSHTVTQSGTSRIQGVGAWASSANTRQIQVRVNGATVADQSSSTSGVDPVATSADLSLAAGDVVELWARHSNALGSNRAVTPTLTFT